MTEKREREACAAAAFYLSKKEWDAQNEKLVSTFREAIATEEKKVVTSKRFGICWANDAIHISCRTTPRERMRANSSEPL